MWVLEKSAFLILVPRNCPLFRVDSLKFALMKNESEKFAFFKSEFEKLAFPLNLTARNCEFSNFVLEKSTFCPGAYA